MRLALFFICFTVLGFTQDSSISVLSLSEMSDQDRIVALNRLEFLGDSLGYKSQWHDAVSYYKQLTILVPENADYHFKYGGVIGRLAQQQKNLNALKLVKLAKAELKMAAKLDHSHKDVRWALVELYTELPFVIGGSMSKALRYAEELENLSKAHGFLAKALIYERSKDWNKSNHYSLLALEEVRSSSFLDSNYSNALNFRIGFACVTSDKYLDMGKKVLIRYIDWYSTRDSQGVHWAYFNLAQINRKQGNQKNALFWIDKALGSKTDFKLAVLEKQEILRLQ